MLHNGTQILLDYWQTLKAGRPAPMRHEISPAAISQILPSTFILQNSKHEFDEKTSFEFRLAGTSLCLLFTDELKGRSFENLLDQHERRLMARLFNTVHSEKVVVQILLHAVSETGRDVYLECIVLPLGDEEPRLLGAIHIMDMPYWVGAERIISMTIGSVRLLDTDRDLISLHNRPPINLQQRIDARRTREKSKRFSVLQGGAMLGAPQISQTSAQHRKAQLRVVPGGLR